MSGHGLHLLVWSSIKGTTSEALAPEVPILKHLKLKLEVIDKVRCSHTLSCEHNSTPQKT